MSLLSSNNRIFSFAGKNVVGEYIVEEPGGNIRIVTYHADPHRGFFAHVRNFGGNNHQGGTYGGYEDEHHWRRRGNLISLIVINYITIMWCLSRVVAPYYVINSVNKYFLFSNLQCVSFSSRFCTISNFSAPVKSLENKNCVKNVIFSTHIICSIYVRSNLYREK